MIWEKEARMGLWQENLFLRFVNNSISVSFFPIITPVDRHHRAPLYTMFTPAILRRSHPRFPQRYISTAPIRYSSWRSKPQPSHQIDFPPKSPLPQFLPQCQQHIIAPPILTTVSRFMSTRKRLREAVRGEYLRWKQKQHEAASNQSKIICSGWIRIGPEPVKRMKSKDVRSAKEWVYYSNNTTKLERLLDSLDAPQFKLTWLTRSIFASIMMGSLSLAMLAEWWWKPTEQPGWFEGSLAPDVRQKLREEVYPKIGWISSNSNSDISEHLATSGRDGGIVKLQIDPKETPLLAKTSPATLSSIVYHDEYAISDKTPLVPSLLFPNQDKDKSVGPTKTTFQGDQFDPQDQKYSTHESQTDATQLSSGDFPNQIADTLITPETSDKFDKSGKSNQKQSPGYRKTPESFFDEGELVPLEPLIGINNPKDYLSTFLTHLPPTASFPTQIQVDRATRVLLSLPPIPPVPVKPPNTAFSDKEIRLLEQIMDLNIAKKKMIEEILGSKQLVAAAVRDEMNNLYLAEQELKAQVHLDQIELLRQLRHQGVLSTPTKPMVIKIADWIRGGEWTKEEGLAIQSQDFQVLYEDWCAVNRPLSERDRQFAADELFDPQKSIFSAQRWMEAVNFVPSHEKPIPLHRLGRFPSQFDIASREYVRGELYRKADAIAQTNNPTKQLVKPRPEHPNDYYHRHLKTDYNDGNDLEDEDMFGDSEHTESGLSLYDQIEQNRKLIAARESQNEFIVDLQPLKAISGQ